MPRTAPTALRRFPIDPGQAMNAAPFVVFLLGLGLRVFQLGKDCFWFDEVGVARVAQSPALAGVLAGAREHVIAMPLDYVVAWVVSRLSVEEWALRLPSAVWGALAVLAGWWLFRKLGDRKAAAIAALFLALSPLHIQYSQELRFYAPLTFFSLISAGLLLEAIRCPTLFRWAVFTLVAGVGVFFHVYVLLALLTGLLWIGLGPVPEGGRRKTLLGFFGSGAVLGVLFVAGWLFLTGRKSFDFPLLYSDSSLLKALATGLGWLPPFMDAHWVGLALGALYLYLTLIGALTILRTSRRSYAALFLLSSAIQIGLIFLSDLATGYFFKDRQVLHLLPAVYFLAASGLCAVGQSVHGSLARAGASAVSKLTLPFLVGLIVLLNVPPIHAYYAWGKNDSCRISRTLVDGYTPGASILVVPKWEYLDYTYYVGQTPQAEQIVPAIQGIEWEELPGPESYPGPVFLVAEPAPDAGQRRLLEAQSFEPYLSTDWEGKLWYRAGR